MVGASWKGISYIRIMPASVANPRTEGQVNQRNKFSVVQAFLKPNRSFLRVGYKFYANKMSAVNAAMAYVIKNAITGTAPDFEIDYPVALVSRGILQGVVDGEIAVAAQELNVSWANNSTQGNARPDDLALILVYNPTKQESVTVLSGYARSLSSAPVPMPDHFVGDVVQVYLAFQAPGGSMVSNSSYLGSVEITA